MDVRAKTQNNCIYAVETKGYGITTHKIELSCPVLAGDMPVEYKTKNAVYIDADHMVNVIPAAKMKCVLSLQGSSHSQYHTIVYFPCGEDIDQYLEIATDMRNKRLDAAILKTEQQLEELKRVKSATYKTHNETFMFGKLNSLSEDKLDENEIMKFNSFDELFDFMYDEYTTKKDLINDMSDSMKRQILCDKYHERIVGNGSTFFYSTNNFGNVFENETT